MSDVPPTIRDHPDFMPPSGAASFALIDTGLATTGLFDTGLFDVSSWSSLSIRLDLNAGAAGPFFVTLNWFSAINGGRGIPIAQRNILVEAGDAVFYSFPNFGSAVSLILTPLGAAVPWAGGLNMTCRADALHNVPARDLEILGSGVIGAGLIRVNNTAICSNGGWANLYGANSAAGASTHVVQYLSGAGVWTALASLNIPVNDDSKLIWLPQKKFRTLDINRGGVGQNIVSALVLA